MKIKNKFILALTLFATLNTAHAITISEAAIIAAEEQAAEEAAAAAAASAASAAASAAAAEQAIKDGIFALDDSNSITKNDTSITGNVTTNDGGVGTAILTSQPATDYGSLTFLSDGSYSYTLNNTAAAVLALESGEALSDLFSYQIVGEHFYTDTAVLTIQILGKTFDSNAVDETFYAFNDENSIFKTSAEVTGDVTSNDLGGTTYSLSSEPVGSYGTLAFLSDGSYIYHLDSTTSAVQDLLQGDFLTDTFTYEMKGFGKTVSANIIISILGQNSSANENFYAFDDENSIVKNSTSITGNVTTNDTGGLTYSLSGNPTSSYGSLVFLSDGSYTYRLNNDASAVSSLVLGEFLSDKFTYEMKGLNQSVTANIIIRIIGKTGSLTDEEDAAAAAAEDAKEEELKAFFTVDDFFSIVKTDNDSTTATTAGNVISNDSNVVSVTLNGIPIGSYGNLAFNNDGTFIYTLNTNSEAIKQLTSSGYLDDVFTYTAHGISASTGEALTETGTLTIRILSESWSITQNVEIEPNDITADATPVTSGQLIKGHLQELFDRDLYKINSLGDEIIHLELCPKGEICEKDQAWALFVFDGDLFPAVEFSTFRLRDFVQDGSVAYVNPLAIQSVVDNPLQTCPNDANRYCNNTVESADFIHYYYLKWRGDYGDSLIGAIDPCHGTANSLDIGVGSGAKTYYVAVVNMLENCDDGIMIQERAGDTYQGPTKDLTEDEDKATIEEWIFVLPANFDQYSISITSTGVNPLKSTRTLASSFNTLTNVLLIPDIQIGDANYAAELSLQTSTKRSGNFKFDLVNMAKLEAELKNNIPATYNPVTNRVRIPKYVDHFGVAYSVDLLYHPAQNGQDFYLELMKMDIIE